MKVKISDIFLISKSFWEFEIAFEINFFNPRKNILFEILMIYSNNIMRTFCYFASEKNDFQNLSKLIKI